MKIGDLVRIKKLEWMDEPGYLLYVLSIEDNNGYGIIILSGPRLGQEHVIHPDDHREFEVIA
jgi:hypothetical protein